MGICSGKYRGGGRLDGKTAIITGCNTGIGKFTALDFYTRGCRVIMACRDVQKAEAAREEIEKKCAEKAAAGSPGQLLVLPLDLASLASVREFADKVLRDEAHIHLLINNAGVMMCPKLRTADGFELQFGTNHLGHYLLTLLLLPRILASAPARIVIVSSLAHTLAGSLDWDNLNAEKSYNPIKNYAVSKLANVLFSNELSRRLQGSGVTIYSLHPGVVNTDLSRHVDSMVFPGAYWLYRNFTGFLQKNEEQGAATTLYCALDPKTETQSGLYYSDIKATPCHAQANDVEKAKRLWQLSWQMVQLDEAFDPFTPRPR